MITARHVRRGTMRVLWVTTISNTAAPTVAQLNAGTDISQWIAGIDGFGIRRVPVPLPIADGVGTVVSVIGDPIVDGTPTLTMYDEGTGTATIRTTLAVGNVGYLAVCLDGAPTATERVQVWHVVSSGPVDQVSGDAMAATFTVWFALVAPPVLTGVIAA